MSYKPTHEEIKRHQRLLAELTPDKAEYREYDSRVDFFIDLVQPELEIGGEFNGFVSLRTRESRLFKRRKYLVAYMSTDWFQQVAPTCDAVASPGISSDEYFLPPPPLIFVPETASGRRDSAFVSVLEHETVHINQALLGTFPDWPTGRSAEDMTGSFFSHTRSEYEAEVLQLTRWPQLYPTDFGMSLDHWCVLRGYTQSLEKHLIYADKLGFPPDEVVRFLNRHPKEIPDGFRRIGVGEQHATWFMEHWVQHVGVALTNLLNLSSDLMEDKVIRAVGGWFKRRLNLS